MAMDSPWAREITLRLAECGMQIHAIAFAQQPKASYLNALTGYTEKTAACFREHSVAVHLLQTHFRSDFRYVACGRTLHAIVRQCGIDVLLLLGGGGFATAAFFSRFRPYVLYAVGSDVLLARGLRRIINRITYRAAELIYSNGHYLGERAKDLTWRSDVRSLCLGIDTDRFVPPVISPSSMSILCNRGFDAVYNNEYLLEGLAELGDHVLFDEAVYTAAGPGLSLARVKAATLRADVARRIHFLGGVSDEEMLARLHRSSVYVSLSRSDGTSISLLEALSCGVFPVVSDIPQNREWINPILQNGILVPLDRPKELAKALERALTDRKLRENATRVNRQIIVERADARKNMAILAKALKETVRINHAQQKGQQL